RPAQRNCRVRRSGASSSSPPITGTTAAQHYLWDHLNWRRCEPRFLEWAGPCGQLCHLATAAVRAEQQTRRAPCIPAAVVEGTPAILRWRVPRIVPEPHKPSIVSGRQYLRVRLRRTRVLRGVEEWPIQFPPVRPGSHGFSPACRCVPETQCCRPKDSGPGRQFYINTCRIEKGWE